jgi:formiminotetrahydrofolate cyclodeaminase
VNRLAVAPVRRSLAAVLAATGRLQRPSALQFADEDAGAFRTATIAAAYALPGTDDTERSCRSATIVDT